MSLTEQIADILCGTSKREEVEPVDKCCYFDAEHRHSIRKVMLTFAQQDCSIAMAALPGCVEHALPITVNKP